MDVISPSNLQNQQQNQNSNLGNQNVAEETIAQPEAQASTLWKIFDSIRTSVFQLFLIALFSILILTTFNYFNLIPLSSVFSFLSFLPQQQSSGNSYLNNISQDDITFFNSNISSLSACKPILDKNTILNPIITCKNPTKILNTSNKPIYSGIPNTDVTNNNGIQVNFALKIKLGVKYQLSGLILGGGPEENRLFITYDNNTNNWSVIFLYGKTATPLDPLYVSNFSSVQRGYFSILISKDGKQVTILLPNGFMKSYTLKGSLYTKYGTIPATAVVEPKAEVDVYSLNYYTPQ